MMMKGNGRPRLYGAHDKALGPACLALNRIKARAIRFAGACSIFDS